MTKRRKLNSWANLWTIACCSLLASPAFSGQVDYPDDSYSSGDTLTAGDLNAKFNKIKTEINDNNLNIESNSNNISTNTTNIDNNTNNISTNTTNIGNNTNNISTNLTSINTNSDAIVELKNPTGAVSVSAHAFRTETTGDSTCQWKTNLGIAYGSLVSGNLNACRVVAGIQIPDGVTMTSLSCNVNDATDAAEMRAYMYQHNNSSAIANEIFATPLTGKPATDGRRNIVANSPGDLNFAIVDNAENAYSLGILFSSTPATIPIPANLSLYSCTVTYE